MLTELCDIIKNSMILILIVVVILFIVIYRYTNNHVTYYVYPSKYDVTFPEQVAKIISNTDWYGYKIKRVLEKDLADIKIKLSDKKELDKWHNTPEYYPSGRQIRFSITTQSIWNKPCVFIDKDNWLNGVPESGLSLDNYRKYVVRHEFMHALGFDHQPCIAGKDKICSVMYQSTRGCPNGTQCGYEVKKEDLNGPRIPGRYL